MSYRMAVPSGLIRWNAAARAHFHRGANPRRGIILNADYILRELQPTTTLTNKPRVLVVNHGFPPRINAGSEIYTQTLANHLEQSGYCSSVTVFAREHDAFRPDFSIRKESEHVVLVHLMNMAREAPYFRFISEPVNAEFEKLLQRLKPDIVHFNHLHHLSTSLCSLAKQSGAKVVYTLHDYWLMCPRGQFLVTGMTKPTEKPWQQCFQQENGKCAFNCFASRYGTGLESLRSSEAPVVGTAAAAGEATKRQGGAAVLEAPLPSGGEDILYWTTWIQRRMQAIRDATSCIDAFIAPSVTMYQRFSNDFLVTDEEKKKLLLLPYGFDRSGRLCEGKLTRSTHPGDGSAEHPYVLAYIGRHEAAKGVHLLIEAVHKLVQKLRSENSNTHFKVLIFGRSNGDTTSSLMRMVSELGLAGKERVNSDGRGSTIVSPVVEFRGEYDNREIIERVFNHVDAVVVPSIWEENSPLVIQEAQQCKIPVITSNYGGMAELVSHGVNGLTFKHRDATSLSEALYIAVNSPELMRAIGNVGYLYSRDGQVPSIEGHVRDIISLYDRLIQGRDVQPSFTEDRMTQSEYPGLIQHLREAEAPVAAAAAVAAKESLRRCAAQSATSDDKGGILRAEQEQQMRANTSTAAASCCSSSTGPAISCGNTSSTVNIHDRTSVGGLHGGSSSRGVGEGGGGILRYRFSTDASSSKSSSTPPILNPPPKPITPLPAPWRITFDTNPDDCTYSCVMCEQFSAHSPYQKERKEKGIKRRRMDPSVIRKVVEEMAPLGLKEIIPSTMGEPLMYEHFMEMVDLCQKHSVKLNLTTNGSFNGHPKSGLRNAREWARTLVPVCSDVKISWNGATKEVHESIMKKSRFEDMVNNLQAFVAVRDAHAIRGGGNYCTVTLQCTFMEQNLEELPDLVRFAIDRGCDRVKGHQLWTHGFPELENQSLRRTPESRARWNKVVKECHRISLGDENEKLRLENFDLLDVVTGATIPFPDSDGNLAVLSTCTTTNTTTATTSTATTTVGGAATVAAPASRGNEDDVDDSYTAAPMPSTPSAPLVCPFLGKEAWVDPEGRFHPCCAPAGERKSLGDFGYVDQKGQSMMTVWQSTQYTDLVRNYHQKPLCNRCLLRRQPKEGSL